MTEYKGTAFNLFVKQNALFTANLTSLNEHYAVTCIVRNPVDVFMSWWSINLPVSKGRLPAAEKFDSDLAKTLEKNGVFWRQMRIYEWFCHQFKHSKSPVIKYEDIISSGGKCLFDACELNEAKLESLNTPERQFKPEELKILKNQSKAILNLNTQGFYSLNDISGRLNQLLSNID
ncbi:hypothetical protein [Glaciecola sp. KUL10]|uniref:hypothetical protein n=1 Tax=Glaciecola sp. (strain KUL10) TaxID=2161813 RepID=UPI000D887703|nr:hypothetical protein [Glaciecola sp. KUL10]GBL04166.1 hypothetical protein KUL10_14720 [Glaciecola sp. KUL10]